MCKQDGIAEIHQYTKNDVVVGDIAWQVILQHPVCVHKRGNAKHHLHELDSSDADVYSTWDLDDALCSDCIVCVHYGVNEEVHDDEDATLAMRVDVCIPAVAEDSDVMVPVEKHEFLFSEDNE